MKYLLSLFFLLLSSLVYAAPKAELWAYWLESDEGNQQTLKHQEWQRFLDIYLLKQGENNVLAYKKVSATDKQGLKDYISGLALLDPRQLRKDEQYAYWLNLYNSLTVDHVLEHYPITSITDLGGWFSFGPWDQELVEINGKALSLNDIEHRILRPIWQEPRTHYALNCASLGCPNLLATAFKADNLETLLELAASDFINSNKGITIDDEKVVVSAIYDWFASDFGSQQALVEHWRHYRPELKLSTQHIIYDYNWNLNADSQ